VPIVYPKTKKDAYGKPQWVSNANNFLTAPIAAWDGGPNLGFGDSGRDAVVGPGRTNFNTSLYKTFYFGKVARFEFRAETFNTFNHTEFAVGSGSGAMNDNPTDPHFGELTNAADARVFQFGGKIIF